MRDQTLLKILLERDSLTESYYLNKENKGNCMDSAYKQSGNKEKKERATILESVNVLSREHSIISQLH